MSDACRQSMEINKIEKNACTTPLAIHSASPATVVQYSVYLSSPACTEMLAAPTPSLLDARPCLAAEWAFWHAPEHVMTLHFRCVYSPSFHLPPFSPRGSMRCAFSNLSASCESGNVSLVTNGFNLALMLPAWHFKLNISGHVVSTLPSVHFESFSYSLSLTYIWMPAMPMFTVRLVSCYCFQ